MTTFSLEYKWTVSKARDTYGYNLCSLYVNGELVSRCNGGGYDMEGTVLGNWIAKQFPDLLRKKIKEPFYGLSFYDPTFDPGKAVVGDSGQTVEERERLGVSMGLERYQAAHNATSPTPTKRHTMPSLRGSAGKGCMIHVLKTIGGEHRWVHSTERRTIEEVVMPN